MMDKKWLHQKVYFYSCMCVVCKYSCRNGIYNNLYLIKL